jgi:NAD(P)-dependent dehydrogenase (short-subunit alcohol dehydrogenase family)
MDDTDLKGKTALVTGASRGIGQAAAQCLADLGANVILTARTQDAADAAAERPSGAVGFAAHAADEDAARRCVDSHSNASAASTSLSTTPERTPHMVHSSTSITTPSARRSTSICGHRSCGHPWLRGHG